MQYNIYIDENPLDVIDESLVDLHASENGLYDKTMNREIHDSCNCIVFSENNEQFGYYIFVVLQHHNYNKIVFQDVSYFIKKEFRLKYAREIFHIVETVAKKSNCNLMITHCRTKSQLNFFKKMDFEMKEYLLLKEV